MRTVSGSALDRHTGFSDPDPASDDELAIRGRPLNTIRELAESVLELTGATSKIVYRDLPADDPKRRRPDISLAQEKLGWQPTVPLAEGLAKTIDWFQSIDIGDYRPPTPSY